MQSLLDTEKSSGHFGPQMYQFSHLYIYSNVKLQLSKFKILLLPTLLYFKLVAKVEKKGIIGVCLLVYLISIFPPGSSTLLLLLANSRFIEVENKGDKL